MMTIPTRWMLGFWTLLLTAGVQAEPSLQDHRYLAYTAKELRDTEQMRQSIAQWTAKIQRARREARQVQVYTDRVVYLGGDVVGQAVVDAWTFEAWNDAASLRVTLATAAGRELDQITVPLGGDQTTCKLLLRLPTDQWPPDRYVIKAQVLDGQQQALAQPGKVEFERSAQQVEHVEIPRDGLPLHVLPLRERESQHNPGSSQWPISTGIPFPRGAVRDVSQLVLLEDGKPAPGQWAVRSRWSPTPDGFVRWAALDFVARYRDGKPCDYRIALAERPAALEPGLSVEQTDQQITVNNGSLRFVVRRRGFDGIHEAWLDGSTVVQAAEQGGPSIVDDAGRRHWSSLDPQAQVSVQEQGPVRVVIRASGWYVSDDAGAAQLCRYITHLSAYAGVPAIFVSHRTIIAYDTRTAKLADVAFHVPMTQAQRWATGIDGTAHEGAMPDPGQSAWVHQYRDDRVRLMEQAEGRRADGWMAAANPAATLLCTLRDMWQKFPKELESSRDGLTLHFWPRHGLDTFSDDEQLGERDIFKIRFAHQGRLLDLQMPQRYFDTLQQWNEKSKWDPEFTGPIGFASTAEGVAIGNEFALWFLPSSTQPSRCAELASEFQDPPHALAQSSWNVSAGIDAPMARRDEQRWPLAERLLNRDFPDAMFNVVNHVGAYGMWIYANTFNTWREDLPGLHRVFQNSHYGQVGESWKLYFRSGARPLLRWARAQSDHHLNIGTVHHRIEGVSPPGRMPGAMYHVKGFLPWGARQRGQFAFDKDVGHWGHFADPDAWLWRYLLQGDLFAGEVYLHWTELIDRGEFPTFGPGRESINNLGMLLNAYAMTWDPQDIVHLYRRGVNVTLATPLESTKRSPGGFPVWHKRWPDRYHMLTRDPRAVASLGSYVRAGYRHWAPSAFAYRNQREVELLKPLLDSVYTLTHEVYRHEGDPLHGFAEYVSAREQETLMQLPELLHAFNEAGYDESKLPPPAGYYPNGELYALNPDGRDFQLKIQMPFAARHHDHVIRVLSPSGKTLRTVVVGRPQVVKVQPDENTVVLPADSYDAGNVKWVSVPAGGENGLFVIRLIGYACHLALPATDLPHEGALVAKDAVVRGSVFNGFLAAKPQGTVELSVTAVGYGARPPRVPVVVYVRLSHADGATLLEDSLLHIAQRKQTTVSLTPEAGLRVWPLQVIGEAALQWTGDAPRLLLCPRAQDAAAVFAALP